MLREYDAAPYQRRRRGAWMARYRLCLSFTIVGFTTSSSGIDLAR
jgi:hypothetical protein